MIDQLRLEDLDAQSLEALADDLVELRQSIDWLEAEWIRRVAHFDRREGKNLDGHSSTTAFLKHRCRMAGVRAHRSVALSHSLPAMPFVEKSFSVGDLSLDQVSILTSVPEHLAEELARDEVGLVAAVAELSVADTRRMVDYWRSAVDSPGCEAEAAELEAQRYLFASKTMSGMVKVDALMDPIQGDLFLTAVRAITPPRRDGDDRSPRQRRADALGDLARSFLDSGDAPGSEKPHLLVLADIAALRGQGGGAHETSYGLVLTLEQVRQYACDCSISRVVFGPDSEPIDLGRASRVVPASIARAVIARDRHCTDPGCDRPARWCDIHHIRHWVDGGPTAVRNLRLLCRYHHTREHARPRPPPAAS
jgi:hypothetical protein